MPDVYLQPGDLDAFQAQKVLDFLNRAGLSADQLGAEIEFPDEPDIGVKLGQRLLDARAALGGAFTSIHQVRAVRLIGPERFTEICIAALGFAPERWVELFWGGAPNAAAAETGFAVTLDASPQPAWLGQPLAVTVRVTDRAGEPRAAVPVTVHTGAGKLVWMYGFQRLEGAALTVLSGADGTAVLDLVRDPGEPLSELHHAALQTALASLDVNALSPVDLRAEFRRLADVYLEDRSWNLRRAIDIHVRDQRDTMLAAINPGRWRIEWPVDSVLLQADALAGGAGGQAVARAVTTVVWKNWVGAWLEFFGELLRERAKFASGFADLARKATDAGVIGELLGEAQRFVAGHSGRTALWLGQKTVTDAVAKFTNKDLSKMPLEARAAVLTQLETAAREVDRTHLGSFTLVANAKAELGGKLAGIDLVALERLERAQAMLAQVDNHARRVEGLAAQVATKSAKLDRDIAAFDASRLQFENRLTGLQTSVTTLQTDFTRISGAVRGAPPAPPVPGAATPRKRAPRKPKGGTR